MNDEPAPGDPLTRGRTAFDDFSWTAAFESLTEADESGELGPEDLELLSAAAYMLGRVGDMLEALERAHYVYLESDRRRQAARSAIWMGTNLALRGKMGPASGWIGRGQRLIEADDDCVEQGYLLLPLLFRHEAAGDLDTVGATARAAADIGRRFGDADLIALAMHAEGRSMVKRGAAAAGVALLDEVMLSVTSGDLSPVVTGMVYCSVIEGCYEIHEINRASDWTAALSQWCDDQPDLVAFTGQCLAHRAEIRQLQGSWSDALAEAQRAHGRNARGLIAAQAFYQEGEVHRLRGEYVVAEEAYSNVRQSGGDPQPGMARLRLAQGNAAAAEAGIKRAVAEAGDAASRARLLPTLVDVMLEVGEARLAGEASDELTGIAAGTGIEFHQAAAARGAVATEAVDWIPALASLRQALVLWQSLEVPYEVARTRVLMARSLEGLGDHDTAALEFEAARTGFEQLGAQPDVLLVNGLTGGDSRRDALGLSNRELEVLRLLTTGATNREIAAELILSERTIDRHVSNLYAKLGVGSRAAATAYAYEHGLI